MKIVSYLVEKDELQVASTWWAKTLLSEFVNDAGDFEMNANIRMMVGKRHPWDIPSKRQVDIFRQTLVLLMAGSFSESWDEENPAFGSGCRTLSVDYGPDRILCCALQFAGVCGTLVLPIKTTMWLSPMSVKVRPGYHGVELELFAKADLPHGDTDATEKRS